MTCNCFIVPQDVLNRFASDPDLTEEIRRAFALTARVSEKIRAVRDSEMELSIETLAYLLPKASDSALCTPPPSEVYDCQHSMSLPGVRVPNPPTSADATVKRAAVEATAVAKFYCDVFKRDSLDDHHITLLSSVHYGKDFNNAFWNRSQMAYGDGDGQIFVDFTVGNDVIGHELTHGVTQYSAAFVYSNEAGGLNESISDVFGSMFRQWQASQDVNSADWLIGHEIMGPKAKARGYTCLRDMANPAAAHCLAPQPTHFSQYHAGMDPHYSSGIPNLAFYKTCMAAGGHSWDIVGQIWYKALTGFPPSPNMLMSAFANRTRSLAKSMYPGNATIQSAVNNAWTAVGL
jgi:Zn-dependent metalloprotease